MRRQLVWGPMRAFRGLVPYLLPPHQKRFLQVFNLKGVFWVCQRDLSSWVSCRSDSCFAILRSEQDVEHNKLGGAAPNIRVATGSQQYFYLTLHTLFLPTPTVRCVVVIANICVMVLICFASDWGVLSVNYGWRDDTCMTDGWKDG